MCKYIKAFGYYATVNEATVDLLQERQVAEKDEEAGKFDVFAPSSKNRYTLRIVGLQSKFKRSS